MKSFFQFWKKVSFLKILFSNRTDLFSFPRMSHGNQGNGQYGGILTFNFFEILLVKINLHENLVMLFIKYGKC